MIFSPGLVSSVEERDRDEVCPLVFASSSPGDLIQIRTWVSDQKPELSRLLARHGAILFRNFGLSNEDDFDEFIQAFEFPNFTYAESLSNAVRQNRTERVFTANEAPSEVSIFLHHEMAQTPVFPSKLFFYCELAAQVGGETPLCRSDALLNVIATNQPNFLRKCENLGVRYSNTMPARNNSESGQGRSWRSTLSVETAAEAEIKLQALGYSWQWVAGDQLRVTTSVMPAVRTLSDGRRVFFNQLIAAFKGWKTDDDGRNKAITFGDGSAIDEDDMSRVADSAEALTFDLRWVTGDAVLVDNYLVMHGRRPFKGTRRVLASLIGSDKINTSAGSTAKIY
jgi:alpha-ketoglutarate-dependent taurine dioxygenase